MVFNFRTTSFSFSSTSTEEHPGEIGKFSLDQLKAATQNFKKSNVLNEGKSGRVYRGRLTDGSLVAIKRLVNKGGFCDKHFQRQVEIESMVPLHPNILPLKGLCQSLDERLLVHPLMVNNDLASHLYPKQKKGYQPLDWMIRKRVALGAARGIAHLHHCCSPTIIHRKISTSNILLDENFEAVLANFGMAIMMNDKDDVLSFFICAAHQSVAHRYDMSGECTAKCDVLAFGEVLLELITRHRIFNSQSMLKNLRPKKKRKKRKYAKKQGKLLVPCLQGLEFSELLNNWIDQKLMNESVVELEKFVKLALNCLQHNPALRPEMLDVVATLESLVPPENDEEEHNLAIPSSSGTHPTSNLVEQPDVSPLAIPVPFKETQITGSSALAFPPHKTSAPSQVSNSLLSTRAEIKQCPNSLAISSEQITPSRSIKVSRYPESSLSEESSSVAGLVKTISKEGSIYLTRQSYRNIEFMEEIDEDLPLEDIPLQNGDGETTEAPNDPVVQATIHRASYGYEASSTETSLLQLEEYISITPSSVSLEKLEQMFLNLKTKVSASLPTVPLEDTMIPEEPVSRDELLEAMELIESAVAMPPCSKSINHTSLNSAFSKLMEFENVGLRVGIAFDTACVKERTFETISIVSKANDTISEVDSTEKRMLSLDASFESVHPLFTHKKNSLTQVQAEIKVLEGRLAALKLLESELRGEVYNLYSRAAQDGEELSRLKLSWPSLSKNRESARRQKEQAMKDWESLRALVILCKQQL